MTVSPTANVTADAAGGRAAVPPMPGAADRQDDPGRDLRPRFVSLDVSRRPIDGPLKVSSVCCAAISLW